MLAILAIVAIILTALFIVTSYRNSPQAVESLPTISGGRKRQAAFSALPPVQTDYDKTTRQAASDLMAWAHNQQNRDYSDTMPDLAPVGARATVPEVGRVCLHGAKIVLPPDIY